MNKLFPVFFYPSVWDIPYNDLWAVGVRALVFDVDNTLAPYDVPLPEERILTLFRGLANQGFRLCLLSNNKSRRVELFGEQLGALVVPGAKKPGTKAALSACQQMEVTPGEAALIGDQIFTDILCANNCGMVSILVEPVSDRDEWQVRLKRIPEKWVLRACLKRFMIPFGRSGRHYDGEGWHANNH